MAHPLLDLFFEKEMEGLGEGLSLDYPELLKKENPTS